jgi:hypothetical protein
MAFEDKELRRIGGPNKNEEGMRKFTRTETLFFEPT